MERINCYQIIVNTKDATPMMYITPVSVFETKNGLAIFTLLSEECGKSWSNISDVCNKFLEKNSLLISYEDFIPGIPKEYIIKGIYLYAV